MSKDDLEVWRKVTRTVIPRADMAPPTVETVTETAAAPPPPAPTPRQGPPLVLRPEGRTGAPPEFGAPKPGVGGGLDKRTEKRLAAGKRAPDARLDLHGMTADRAHRALRGFIADSRAKGRRMVLVITGKGGPSDVRAFGDRAPGVLRREAPIWLSTPPLSQMVVDVRPAHQRHGGGGALYVYLKRQR